MGGIRIRGSLCCYSLISLESLPDLKIMLEIKSTMFKPIYTIKMTAFYNFSSKELLSTADPFT